jgi:LysM repeat protein
MSQAKKWSCCKDLNPEAPGCRTDYHQEDTEFTDFLCESYSNITKCAQNSPQPPRNSLHLAPRAGAPSLPAEPSDAEEDLEKSETSDKIDDTDCPKGYQRHKVSETDTLTKLELAYDTTASAIKAANQLVTDRDMYSREYLLIPSLAVPSLPPPPKLSKAAREARKISLFSQITKCDSLEARGYLETHDWDMDKSVKEYQNDIRWENNAMAKELEKQSRVCC